MSVHCRFRLVSITKSEWTREGGSYRFSPVTGEPFGSATPNAQFEMTVMNPAAAAEFDSLGAEYDVILTKRTPVDNASQA